MSLIVKTKNAKELLDEIKKAIDAKRIETWSYDSSGDFTHTPEQWKTKAWLRPQLGNDEVKFGFLGNTTIITTKMIYAVYHGRFAEMILSHFDEKIISIETSAMPTSIDAITQTVK